MRLHFLGGADEVGASCLLVEAAGRRILVDAGVRMGAAATDRLPDLARVQALLGPETGSGLYKKGADRETWSLRLGFDFPDMDGPRAADAIATLSNSAGSKE
jgi:hypothetical protein